ncbi:GNAT family N-acetyltransferase [Homoserinimonas sp. A447]
MRAESQAKTTIEMLDTVALAELLQFERENRDYFAEWVPDRGDDYFTQFQTRNQALLDEQSAEGSFFFVVRDESNQLVGRVNLVDATHRSASLGYRIAQKATGVGHAGRAVKLATVFARDYGLEMITAMTTLTNVGSRRVLERSGFVEIAGRPASVLQNGAEQETVHYALDLGSLV